MTIERAIQILDPEHREHYDDLEEVNEACRMGMDALKQMQWISVTEQLPKELTPVNIVWFNRNPMPYYEVIRNKPFVATGLYFKGRWYWYSAVCEDYLREYGDWEPDRVDAEIEITHWMPLPEPPKEETE